MILIKLFQSEAHHGDEASDEAEVCEVVGIDGRGRVDLQTVVVLAGVFKQTVHGVQHLVGQQEEPLPAEPEDRRHLCWRGRYEWLREDSRDVRNQHVKWCNVRG